jgi:hypothetical protein
MYIKFLKHGMGAPEKAASYLISDIDHLGYKRAGVETLRGDAKTFVAIASSLTFKHRYTSGVIAWSKEDAPTDKQISETLDAFERHAFAGLDPTRYHMNAVLHVSDDGSKHVHILIPKVDLATGKSLNVAPPGHENYFDKLRDYLNEKHQWSKPDQIAILNAAAPLPDDLKDQSLSDLHAPLPNHIHAQRAAAKKLNFSGMKKGDQRELLYQSVKVLVDAGFVRDRKDVVHFLGDYGVIKQRKDYISITIEGEKTAIRLTGEFFKDGFIYSAFRESSERAAADQRSSSLHGVNRERCEKLGISLQKAADARADFHARRYAVTASRTEQPSGTGLQHPAHSLTGSDRSSSQALSGVKDPSFRGAGLGYGGAENQPEPTKTAKGELQHSATVGGTAKNELDPSRTDGGVEGQTASKLSFISVMSSLDGSHDHTFIGEVNERIRSTTITATRLAAEPTEAVRRGRDAIIDLQQAINRKERPIAGREQSIEGREQSKIPFDLNAEVRAVKSQIRTVIQRATDEIQREHKSNFTAAVECYFNGEKPSINGRYKDRKHDYTLSEGTFGSEFQTFYTQFKQFERNRSQQARRASGAANGFAQQLADATSKIDLMVMRLRTTDYFKPRSCTDLTEYFGNICYRYRAADRLHEWSKRQNQAVKKGDLTAVVSYIESKYQEVVELMRQKPLDATEIELLQKIVKNDECIVGYMRECGNRLSREDQQKIARVFSTEKVVNEARLSKLQESIEQPAFEPKSDPTPSKPTKENTRTYDSPSPSPFD